MHVTTVTGPLAALSTPCLILGVLGRDQLPAAGAAIDAATGGRLAAVLARGDLDGEVGRTLLLHDLPGLTAPRLLLVGLGAPEEFDRARHRKALAAAVALLQQTGAGAATWILPEPLPREADRYLTLRDAVLTAADKVYRYTRTKADKKAPKTPLAQLDLWVPDSDDLPVAGRAVAHGMAMAGGIALARELGNLPPNLCTPTYLAEQARELAGRHPALSVEVLDADAMAALGMNALLAVARGSREPARLIVLHYRNGPADAKPVVLVGKGLTFDAGGISIKPAEAMDEMKYDMCGGAGVLGTIQAACALGLPLHLVGVIPATENLPGGNATRPGDIVTSLSGQTIEILNTDAEGRLILADALTYSERFQPDLVIDLATLTGSCVVALGRHASGLFTADDALAATLLQAGERSGDRAWRMPLWEDYQQQLDSNFADMSNLGGREAGSVTAACFLSRFTKAYRWAHLDIAGTAWVTGKEKGATGRPVALLTQVLLERAGVQVS